MDEIPLSIEEFVAEFAGNWKHFESFYWATQQDLDDPENWGIYYTTYRDADLLTESNAHEIDEALSEFCGWVGDDDENERCDCMSEHHTHWAYGWIQGYAIRCLDKNGNPTEAVKVWHELLLRLQDYPVLDEMEYSNRQYDAQHESIKEHLHYATSEYDGELPEDLDHQVWEWLWENDQRALDDPDGDGWVYESAVKEAVVALGYGGEEDDDEEE